MLLPSVLIKRSRSRGFCTGALRWRGTVERAVHARSVVIVPKGIQLPHQIRYVPEEDAVEIFSANGADQPFDERMRNGRVRNRLDLLDLEYAQVGEPAVESKQRIVVGTQVLRRRLAGNGVIEHPTYGYAVNVSGFDTEADDATCEHVHHDHDPVTPQEYGFASEQVDAPEAILDVPDKCKPGRAVSSGVTRPVVLREHAADNILVNLNAEGMSDLLRDADTAELGIAALRLDDCRNKLGGWTFRARLSSQG